MSETIEEVYKRLVAEKLAANSDRMFDFEGHNCADSWDEGLECSGWDGESRRCSCGNRRVSWVLSDDNTYVYAEAH